MNAILRKTWTSMLLILGLGGLYPTFAQRANETPVRFISRSPGMTRHLELTSLTKAMPPVFVEDNAPDGARGDTIILFTFSDDALPKGPARSGAVHNTPDLRRNRSRNVAITFGYDHWTTLVPLQKIRNIDRMTGGESEVWFLYWTMPQGAITGQTLEYRLVVDGIWMADPVNPEYRTGIDGSRISLLSLVNAPPEGVKSPEVKPAGSGPRDWQLAATSEEMERMAISGRSRAHDVVFRYIAPPGSEISLQGTFNHFDPYMHVMEVTGTWWKDPSMRVYEITLRLLPGTYMYQFLADGVLRLDPLNPERGSGSAGGTYSVLQVP